MGQEFQIGAARFKIGAEITNGGISGYRPGQGIQIGQRLQVGAEQKILFIISHS